MKSTFIAAAVFLSLSLSNAVAAVRLNLTVTPTGDLPALRPTLHLVATNDAATQVALPSRVVLKVQPANDQPPFFARVAEGSDRVVGGHFIDSQPTVQPKNSQDLTFWAGPNAPIWFVTDSRLWNPGKYRFQVLLDDDLADDIVADVEHVLDRPELADALVSNEAEFVVQEPTGADAGVWEMIQASGKSTLWSHMLADEIVKRFPTSRYATFVVERAAAGDRSAEIAVSTRAVERNANTWSGDWSRLALAQFKASEAEHLSETGHIDEALAFYREARNLFETVARRTHDPRLLKATSSLLETPPVTRKDIEKHLAAMSPNPAAEVEPFAECSAKALNGGYIVWFSAGNPTAFAIDIAIGADNKFTPPPFDRGQGTNFPAGFKYKKFSITIVEPELTWHLQKTELHVKVKDLPTCEDDTGDTP
jgi:hypothetical protein